MAPNQPVQQLEVGDTFELTIKGKIADASLVNTPAATSVRIDRPGRPNGYYSGALVGGFTVDAVFEESADITVKVTSRFRNGVHIDSNGRYYMRRPDGFHEMTIASDPIPSSFGKPFTPPNVQRLVEAKDR